jgi:transcriptional regulator with XRE-family HTH domain
MNASDFGKKLRKLRREKDLTLEDLAKAAGCSIVYVSQIELGTKPPPNRGMIEKLMKRLGSPDLIEPMTLLADRSRSSVEISLKDKTPNVAEAVCMLARKADAGEINEEMAQKLKEIFN